MSTVEYIDFSPVHEKYIRNPDGTFSRMDEPYFQAEKIAEGTWKILSSGDYSYLVEGNREAVAIDTGYGAGNIRKFLQTLTEHPVKYVINTHDHFDHTAGNGYFEKAFMSKETAELAGRPFPSFSGISFPDVREKEIVGEGFIFHLGNRDLTVFLLPDHAPGSIALLDSREHLLFTGDELMPQGKRMNGSPSEFLAYMKKLETRRREFDRLCGGSGVTDARLFDRYICCLESIISGHGDVMADLQPFSPETIEGPDGNPAYDRRFPHEEDIPKDREVPGEFLRAAECEGLRIIYDVRK